MSCGTTRVERTILHASPEPGGGSVLCMVMRRDAGATMGIRKAITTTLAVLSFSCLVPTAFGFPAKTYTWNGIGATENWSDGANWDRAEPPGRNLADVALFNGTSSKHCIFDSGSTIATLTIQAAYGTNLTVQGTLTVTDITTANPIDIDLGGKLQPSGNLTIDAGGEVNVGVGQVSVGGDLNNNDTITIGSGTFDANGVFDASAGTVTFTNAGRLELGGAVNGLGTFSPASGTVVYNDSSGAQTVRTEDYYHLEIDTVGQTASANGNVTVGGNLTVTSGTLGMGVNDLTASNSVTVAGILSAGTGTIDVDGAFDASAGAVTFTGAGRLQLGSTADLGTFTKSTSTVEYDGTANQTVDNVDYYILEADTAGSTAAIGFSVTMGGAGNIENELRIAGSGVVDVSAAFDGSNGSVTFTGNGRLQLGSTVTSLGNFTKSTGTVEYAGSVDQTVFNTNYYNIEIDNGTNTATIGSGVTMGGAGNIENELRISGSSTLDANATFNGTGGSVTFTGGGRLRLGGAVTSLGSFTKGTGTIEYDAAANQTVVSTDYHNLEIDNSGNTAAIGFAVSMGAGGNVQNELRISGTGVADVNGAFDGTDGSVTFVGGGRLQLGGTVTSLGTFTKGTGTVEYDAAADQTVANTNYYNLEIDNAGNTALIGFNVAMGADGSVQNQLTITNSIVDVNGTFDGTGGSVLFNGDGRLKLGGTVTSLGSFTKGIGTVEYDAAADQPVVNTNYYRLEIDNAGNTAGIGFSVTMGGAGNIENELVITASVVSVTGTFNGGGGTTRFNGGGDLKLGSTVSSLGTFVKGTGTVVYCDSTTTQTIRQVNYYGLAIDNGGQTATVDYAISPANVANELKLAGSSVLDVNSDFNIGGKLTFTGAGQLTLGGAVTSLGTFTKGSGTVVYDNQIGSQSVLSAAYHHLSIDNLGQTGTVAGAVTVAGSLAITESGVTDSILDIGTNTVSVAGSGTVSGDLRISSGTCDVDGAFDASSGTIAFSGTGSLLLGGAVTGLGTLTYGQSTVTYDSSTTAQSLDDGVDYYNLRIDNAGRTVTANGVLTVYNILTVTTNGTLAMVTGGGITVDGDGGASDDLDVDGTLTMIGPCFVSMGSDTAIAIAGSFSTLNAGGTPAITNAGAGTYSFDVNNGGTLDISGLILSDPDADGLRINMGATVVDIDDVNFNNGQSTGTFLNVRLGAGGADFFFSNCDFDGSTTNTVTTDADFANGVISMSKYINGGSATENDHESGQDDTPSSTIDWVVSTTWIGNDGSDWSDPGNWDNGVPTSELDAIIPSALTNPVVNTDAVCKGLFITDGTLTMNSEYTLEIHGDFQNSGILVVSAGTLKFTGTATHYVLNSGGAPLCNMTVDKLAGSVNITADITVSNDFRVINGIVNCSSHNVTVKGTNDIEGTIIFSTGTLDADGPFDASGGTITFTGAGSLKLGSGSPVSLGALSIAQGTVIYDDQSAHQTILSSGVTYNDLRIDKTTNYTATGSNLGVLDINGDFTIVTGNFAAGNAIDLEGDLVLSAAFGEFSASTFDHTIAGDFVLNGGTFDAGTGGFTFDGGSQSITGAVPPTFADLTIASITTIMATGTKVKSGKTLTVNSELRVLDTVTMVVDGAVDNNGLITLLTGSTCVLDANGDFDATGGTVTFTTGGELRLGGGTPTSLGSTFNAGQGKVVYDDKSSAQTILSANISYNNLVVDKTNGVTATSSALAALDVNGDLLLVSGNLSAGHSIDLEGDLTLTAGAGTFTASTHNHTFAGDLVQKLVVAAAQVSP